MFPNVLATDDANALTGLVTVLATPVTGPALLNILTETIAIIAMSSDADAIIIDLFVINDFIVLLQNPLAFLTDCTRADP